MPDAIYSTLEEAQAEILRLNEELATANTERENYSNRINELTKENEKVRELNQKYFLKLSAQYNPNPDPSAEDDTDVPSCEDFARSIKI